MIADEDIFGLKPLSLAYNAEENNPSNSRATSPTKALCADKLLLVWLRNRPFSIVSGLAVATSPLPPTTAPKVRGLGLSFKIILTIINLPAINKGVKLNKLQRENLSKSLFDIGKLVIAMIALGPLVSPARLSIKIMLLISGIMLTTILFIWATTLLKEG